MGKDGTQLLRHCVRLLLVVGKDLSSVRQSGKKKKQLSSAVSIAMGYWIGKL